MKQVIRIKSNCVKQENAVAAGRDAVRAVVNTPARIRRVCEAILRQMGMGGTVTVVAGAELGDGVLEFLAELHAVSDGKKLDEICFWTAVRQALGAEPMGPASRRSPQDSSSEGREERNPDTPQDTSQTPKGGPQCGHESDSSSGETKPKGEGLSSRGPADDQGVPPPMVLVGGERSKRDELCEQVEEGYLVQVRGPKSPFNFVSLKSQGAPKVAESEQECVHEIEIGMDISALMAAGEEMQTDLWLLVEYEVLICGDDE